MLISVKICCSVVWVVNSYLHTAFVGGRGWDCGFREVTCVSRLQEVQVLYYISLSWVSSILCIISMSWHRHTCTYVKQGCREKLWGHVWLIWYGDFHLGAAYMEVTPPWKQGWRYWVNDWGFPTRPCCGTTPLGPALKEHVCVCGGDIWERGKFWTGKKLMEKEIKNHRVR